MTNILYVALISEIKLIALELMVEYRMIPNLCQLGWVSSRRDVYFYLWMSFIE